MNDRKFAVVLGNRMQDDGTMSSLGLRRLEILKKADAAFSFDGIILSGGIANARAGISEAGAMKAELVKGGFDPARLFLEDRSRSTKENAYFTLELASRLNAGELVIITTAEHMGRWFLNPIRLFARAACGSGIKISAYCEEA